MTPPNDVDCSLPELQSLDLANPLQPVTGILTGGCPSDRDLIRLSRSGLKTVLDLRPPEEWKDDDFPGRVRRTGLAFLNLPVSGLAGMNPALTRRFREYWQDRGLRPMLVHCASGNRVGAMVALAAHRHGGQDPQEALVQGQQAGLKASEPGVRQLLGIPENPGGGV